MAKLTIHDIVDLRAYERERLDFRSGVIALKKKRRVHIGPVVTLLFENRDTVRFQIQEMARAERIISDEGIQAELDIYNPLVPEACLLTGTLFLERTLDATMREWVPKLVGVEAMVELRVGEDASVVRCEVDPDHKEQPAGEEMAASVHYVHFRLTPAQAGAVGRGPVVAAVVHPQYAHSTELTEETRAELARDAGG